MAVASLLPKFEPGSDPRAVAQAWIAAGHAAGAAGQLSSLLAEGRGGVLTRIALIDALQACGRPDEAAIQGREAVRLAPGSAEAAIAYALALQASGELPPAIAELQRAARIDPQAPKALLLLACLWGAVGEWEQALQFADRAEALGGDAAAIRVQIATEQAAGRLPQGFVRHLFDQFSDDYDARMVGRLGYAAPQILRDLYALYAGPKPKPVPGLDLGCGTGLSGRAFADCAKPLLGVDLSPRMLDRARATGVYSGLEAADLEAWLTGAEAGQFGLVLAADVFVYLGDLNGVFAGVAKVLRPGAVFLFTVERGEGPDFALGERRRYQHREAYLRRLAQAHGLDVASLIAATLRYDAGKPIEGIAAALVGPAA